MRFLIFFSLLFFISNNHAHASDDVQDESRSGGIFHLDGAAYSKDALVEDFLNVAFSDLPWNAHLQESLRKTAWEHYFPTDEYIQKYNDRIPQWWEKYFDPDVWKAWFNGRSIPYKYRYLTEEWKMPSCQSDWVGDFQICEGKTEIYQRNRLYKWDRDDFTIGIDWPRYPDQDNYPHGDPWGPITKFTLKNETKYYDPFYKAASGQGELLQKKTGLIIDVLKPDDPTDKTPDFPRIRIVPNRFWALGIVNGTSHVHGSYHVSKDEGYFFNAILFESYSDRIYKGYLLPDQNGVLLYSICEVEPTIPQPVVFAMINECLVRSFGLPGTSNSKNSLMSHWHNAEQILTEERRQYHYEYHIGNDVFKTPFLASLEKTYSQKTYADRPELLQEIIDRIRIIDIVPETLDAFQTIPEYDLMMVAMLYCPALKAGMTPEQAKAVLVRDDTCFAGYDRIKNSSAD